MRVRADSASVIRDIAVPRPVARQKSYKSLLNQASTSSGSSSCVASKYLQGKIEEEEEAEETEMVRGGPSDAIDARAETSQARSNGNNWVTERDEYESDKDDDEELPDEPVVGEIGPQLPGVFDAEYHQDDTLPISGIIVTVSPYEDEPTPSTNPDNDLLIQLRVREYRGNFDGFAEINRFRTIEEMHEFIVNNTDGSMTGNQDGSSSRQAKYLEILLTERSEDRFRRLVETSKGTVRRVLARNEHILQKLFAAASLEHFPSPLGPKDDEDAEDDEMDRDYAEDAAEMEENMKRWYMIEMIGIWLKLVTNVESYREAIKKNLLKTSCGIENDRCEGIAVPLRYK